MGCKKYSGIYNTLIAGAIVFGITNPYFLVFANSEGENIEKARNAVNASVESLISTKDETAQNDESKDVKKLAAAKETIKNVLALGLAEIESLEKKLEKIEVEKLVTDDYTFDAADVHDAFAAGLAEARSYHKTLFKRIENASTQSDAQESAGELQRWREDTYAPLVKKLFSVDLVLKQKTIVTMGNNRFEKILNDLQKLKKAKLITLEPFEELLRQATANQRIAIALREEATQLLLSKLRSEQGAIDNQRITNLVEQSFKNVKNMYKQFMGINALVKKMLDNGTK